MTRYTFATIVFMSAACVSCAHAVTRAARAEQGRQQLAERFAQADVDQNGKLTREEAQDKMPRVFEHFDEIDSAGKGYVTQEDVIAYFKAKMAERGR